MRSDRLDWRSLNGAAPARVSNEDAHELRREKCDVKEPLFKRLLRRLFPDQRKQARILAPPMVGYLGSVRSTKPYKVGDISLSGFCFLTEERWTPGTEMPITLERAGFGEKGSEYFTVQATVVRCGEDGVGFSILLSESESNAAHGNPLQVRWASAMEMRSFLRTLDRPPSLPAQVRDSEYAENEAATPRSADTPFRVRQTPLTQTGSD